MSRQGLPEDDDIYCWIDELRDRITVAAHKRSSTPRQFASTLAALLIGPVDTLAVHIGDSAIVARSEDEWEVICWPENGEYASTTYFVTDDPEPRVNIVRLKSRFDAFAAFSDGVGDLALSQVEQRAHRKFFDPMIRPVDGAQDVGRLPGLSEKLRDFLASSLVCDRTDDDKTIVLLSRK